MSVVVPVLEIEVVTVDVLEVVNVDVMVLVLELVIVEVIVDVDVVVAVLVSVLLLVDVTVVVAVESAHSAKVLSRQDSRAAFKNCTHVEHVSWSCRKPPGLQLKGALSRSV